MIPLIVNSAALAGVVVAAVVAIFAAGLPYRLGLLIAVIAGMTAAMSIDNLIDKRKGEGKR